MARGGWRLVPDLARADGTAGVKVWDTMLQQGRREGGTWCSGALGGGGGRREGGGSGGSAGVPGIGGSPSSISTLQSISHHPSLPMSAHSKAKRGAGEGDEGPESLGDLAKAGGVPEAVQGGSELGEEVEDAAAGPHLPLHGPVSPSGPSSGKQSEVPCCK